MEQIACFIGHRNIPDTEEIRTKIRETVEWLINEENTAVFIFGSKSTFDSLCHTIVTDLQKRYPHIKRIAYTCRHETVVMKENKTEEEQMVASILKHSVPIQDYDGEYEHPDKYTSGRASYVERNQAMIDDSDFCVFYFDASYEPHPREVKSNCKTENKPKSGTSIAYKYALRKKKKVINLCDRKN